MNKLNVTITDIQSAGELHLVTFEYQNQPLTLVSLDISLHKEQEVTIGFKPTAVAIGKECEGALSYSNQLHVIIEQINIGAILTHIKARFKDIILESIITTNSAKRLKLKPKDKTLMLIKATDIFLVDS